MPNRLLTVAFAASLAIAPLFSTPARAESNSTRLLRFPDIHGEKVVFTYGGDLWTAPVQGGSAARLTAHPGLELFAKLSPDGSQIAFTGQYDGDEQVYVVPAGGGMPRQLTWYPALGPLPPRWGYDNQVVGWSRDGKSILFRSFRDGWDLSDSRLFAVPAAGGLPEALPMPTSGAGDLSPDGGKIVYSPLARDFRTWKRYQGGWAQDLYIFDLKTYEQENVSRHVRTDRDPMWIGGKVFFASDRGGKLDLYSYDTATRETRQVTRGLGGDVRWPSRGEDGEIVFELAGALQVLDTETGSVRPIPITVPTDALALRSGLIPVARWIEDFALSPKGERALFVARGDVFTAPIEKGAARNLTRSSSAHDKAARWSPDGAKIAFVSDLSGEEQVYLVDQGGAGKPEALTSTLKTFLYAPAWSPDGKRLAFSDKDGKVYVLTLAGRKLVEVADDAGGPVFDYAWAPGGQHLAFSLSNPSNVRQVHVWSVADGKLRPVTRELVHSYNPAWDPAGKYLYYLSDRELGPQASNWELDFAVNRQTGIFALALRKDVAHPFPPQSDEVTVGGGEKEKKEEEQDGGKEPAKGKGTAPLRIDFDGIADRVAAVPVEPDNYGQLEASSDHLFYVRGGAGYFSRESERKTELMVFSVKDRKAAVLAEDLSGHALSEDRAKVLARHGDGYALYDAKPDGKGSKKEVSTAGLRAERVPAQEWAQIFDESWRRYRDFFYAPNMHGYDWAAIREEYRPLLAHVAHRSDLNYVLGEMIAELNVSHAYVGGGDYDLPERPRVALPGARFTLDPAAGRYRIAEIYRGENDEERYRSPLTEVGVDARVGDYVLAIDGVELTAEDNPYRLLRGKGDGPVELALNDRPRLEGARRVTFRPIDSETPLLYLDWVRKNREKVAATSGGRVGYLHIPDMGGDGLREFIKWYYPQVRKEGLIVDVRSNGGGFVSETIIERLRREVLSLGVSRLSDRLQTYPSVAFHGPMVALINETTASDGDVFAATFQQVGLGPLIGKRTWGGVVGISGHGPLLDGGDVFVPEAGTASPDGRWIIEGHGVDPDVEVENDPRSLLAGRDPQLERGVAEVLKRLEEAPKRIPARPADPVKTD